MYGYFLRIVGDWLCVPQVSLDFSELLATVHDIIPISLYDVNLARYEIGMSSSGKTIMEKMTYIRNPGYSAAV